MRVVCWRVSAPLRRRHQPCWTRRVGDTAYAVPSNPTSRGKQPSRALAHATGRTLFPVPWSSPRSALQACGAPRCVLLIKSKHPWPWTPLPATQHTLSLGPYAASLLPPSVRLNARSCRFPDGTGLKNMRGGGAEQHPNPSHASLQDLRLEGRPAPFSCLTVQLEGLDNTGRSAVRGRQARVLALARQRQSSARRPAPHNEKASLTAQAGKFIGFGKVWHCYDLE